MFCVRLCPVRQLSRQQAGLWERAAGGCSLQGKHRDGEGGNGEESWKTRVRIKGFSN